MTDERRDQLVRYLSCPEDSTHFILSDMALPVSERTPPQINRPLATECRGCGEHHVVQVTQPWKIGYVSRDERNQSTTTVEPSQNQL